MRHSSAASCCSVCLTMSDSPHLMSPAAVRARSLTVSPGELSRIHLLEGPGSYKLLISMSGETEERPRRGGWHSGTLPAPAQSREKAMRVRRREPVNMPSVDTNTEREGRRPHRRAAACVRPMGWAGRGGDQWRGGAELRAVVTRKRDVSSR